MKLCGALEADSRWGTLMALPYLSGEPPELVPALAGETPVNEEGGCSTSMLFVDWPLPAGPTLSAVGGALEVGFTKPETSSAR